MKVHVVGGSGFLGSRLVRRLVARGHEVTGLARSQTAAKRLSDLGARPLSGNLDDPPSVDIAISSSGAQVLVTSVSLGMGHGPMLVTAAEKAGVERGVFVSTTSIFTKLSTRSKSIRLEAEERIRESSLAWTILRPTMIYGAPDDRNMARLLGTLSRWPIMALPGGGTGLQQPVHVDDLADLILACLDRPMSIGRTYDAAGPQALTFRELVDQAADALGRRVRSFSVPLRPVVALARAYERAGGKRLRAEQFERLAEDKAFDITPAQADLGFSPRAFADGIAAEAELLRLRTA